MSSNSEDGLAGYVGDSITYARTAEAIIAAINVAACLATQIERVGEINPEVAPELVAALTSAQECVDALSRAGSFAGTKLGVTHDLLGGTDG